MRSPRLGSTTTRSVGAQSVQRKASSSGFSRGVEVGGVQAVEDDADVSQKAVIVNTTSGASARHHAGKAGGIGHGYTSHIEVVHQAADTNQTGVVVQAETGGQHFKAHAR